RYRAHGASTPWLAGNGGTRPAPLQQSQRIQEAARSGRRATRGETDRATARSSSPSTGPAPSAAPDVAAHPRRIGRFITSYHSRHTWTMRG
ncbi:MAG TPA: hypothetical protein VLD83_03370, partial [Candidatus Binatia bacterium]|nr:hypothetical protein [Candidatus Binatia bacterium]